MGTLILQITVATGNSSLEKAHFKASVAVDKSMLKDICLAVSMYVEKIMPAYPEVFVAMDENTAQQ